MSYSITASYRVWDQWIQSPTIKQMLLNDERNKFIGRMYSMHYPRYRPISDPYTPDIKMYDPPQSGRRDTMVYTSMQKEASFGSLPRSGRCRFIGVLLNEAQLHATETGISVHWSLPTITMCLPRYDTGISSYTLLISTPKEEEENYYSRLLQKESKEPLFKRIPIELKEDDGESVVFPYKDCTDYQSLYYGIGCTDQMMPTPVSGMYIGSIGSCSDAFNYKQIGGIINIVSVCDRALSNRQKGIRYHFVKLADDEPTRLISIIKNLLRRVHGELNKKNNWNWKENWLIHCEDGHNRSAAFVIAYLMKFYHLRLDYALSQMRKYKPCVKPCDVFMTQLRVYEKNLFK